MPPEKAKDSLRKVVGAIRGRRARIDPNPYNNGARNIIRYGTVCDEPGRVDARVANGLGFDDIASKRSNGGPCGVELSIIEPRMDLVVR